MPKGQNNHILISILLVLYYYSGVTSYLLVLGPLPRDKGAERPPSKRQGRGESTGKPISHAPPKP